MVIPCYNSLRFLPETLDSVLHQELPPDLADGYEVVLVDDGGSDDLAGWAERRRAPNLRVVRQDNAGVAAARNLGIAESTGDLIAFCDSDDLWTPGTAAALAEPFQRDPSIGMSYGWYDVVDAEGRATGRVHRPEHHGTVWEQFVLENPVAASGVMVRRDVLAEVGDFAVNRSRFRIDVEDWELWIRIAARCPVGLAPRIVVHHRRHDSNSSTDVESIEAAYRHLLEVVFATATPEQRRLRPIATARIEQRLASHWINDRQDPVRGLDHLARAVSLDPGIRRTGEYRRLRATGTVLRVAGRPGYQVLRALNRAGRLLADRRGRARAGRTGLAEAGRT